MTKVYGTVFLLVAACHPTEVGDGAYVLASASAKPEFCITDEQTRERIRGIMMEALDEALHDQIKHLFLTWLKDERGQPERARVGARQAIEAHQSARKNAVEWMPPICSG